MSGRRQYMSNASRLKIVAHASIDACFELPVTKKLVAVLFNEQKGVYRMNEYVFSADLLNKFHTALPWVQALMVIAACIAIIGVAYFTKESITAIMRPFCKQQTGKEKETKKGYEDKWYRGEEK
jgi:hypothetical protein